MIASNRRLAGVGCYIQNLADTKIAQIFINFMRVPSKKKSGRGLFFFPMVGRGHGSRVAWLARRGGGAGERSQAQGVAAHGTAGRGR